MGIRLRADIYRRVELVAGIVADAVAEHHVVLAAVRRKGWSHPSEVGDDSVLTSEWYSFEHFNEWLDEQFHSVNDLLVDVDNFARLRFLNLI